MSEVNLFALENFDDRFEHVYVNNDLAVFVCLFEGRGSINEMCLEQKFDSYGDYLEFFGKIITTKPCSSKKELECKGENFLKHLTNSVLWQQFIENIDKKERLAAKKQEESEFVSEEDDSSDSEINTSDFPEFFLLVHYEPEEDEDKYCTKSAQNFVIDGVFFEEKEAVDYMDSLSKDFSNVEFFLMNSIGSVKRNVVWNFYE